MSHERPARVVRSVYVITRTSSPAAKKIAQTSPTMPAITLTYS